MKVSTKSLSQATRAIFRHRNRQPTKLINPSRDWLVGFFAGVLILIAIPTWSAYMYLTNRHSDIQPDIQLAAQVPVYRAAAVDQALQYFATRRESFAALRADTAATVVVPEPTAAVESAEVPTPEAQPDSTQDTDEPTAESTVPTPAPVFR